MWDLIVSVPDHCLSFYFEYFLQRPCDERGGSQQNLECHWNAWCSPNHGKEKETQMVWPHLKILWHGEDNSARDSERSKKERKTEEEMGRYIKEWMGMGSEDSVMAAEDREGWKSIVATLSVVPHDLQCYRTEMRWDEIAQIKVSNSPITKKILPQRPPPFFNFCITERSCRLFKLGRAFRLFFFYCLWLLLVWRKILRV